MERATLILAVLVLAISAGALAQSPQQEPSKTKLEAFMAADGAVIVQGFSKIGDLKGQFGSSIVVEAKEFTNASSGRKEYGLAIEVKEAGRLEREHTSYVDYDEIDSLLKGIDYISKVDRSATKLSDFQADYRTRGDLRISTFSSDSNVMAGVDSGRIGKASAIIRLADLSRLRDLVAGAKVKLDAIR